MTSIKAPFKQSPLAHRDALISDDIQMSERAHLGKVMLRGDLATLNDAIANVVSVAGPKTSHSVYTGKYAVHWLGPDTLLAIANEEAGDAFTQNFATILADKPCQVTNVSNNYTVIELKGDSARDTLQKLSTLDLDPAQFGKTSVAGTIFGLSNVILACREAKPDTFDIVIRRSHADYLWCLIADAGYEYGLDKQAIVAGETLRQ